MKKSRSIYQTAKNISKLHKHVLDLLTSEESIFKNFNIQQEYKVQEINSDFSSGRERFDIVIVGLQLIIECMGIQHFEPSTFGGRTLSEAKKKLKEQQERDHLKEQAARKAGWAYVTVSYKEPNLTLKELTDRIREALTLVSEVIVRDSKPKAKIQSNSKLQSRGFQKKPEGYKYKWPKRKLNS